MPWLALFEIAAAVNAFLLAIVLLLNRRLHRTRARMRLAGFLFCVGWLLTTFMLVDQGWLAATPRLQLIDDTLALLLSVLFLEYVSDALGRRPMPFWVYAPTILYFIAGAIGGQLVLNAVRIEHIIVVQFSYTFAATLIFLHARKSFVRQPRHLIYLLGGLWILHIAQFIRMLWPSTGWIFDMVPLVGVVFILGLTILVLTDSPALKIYTQKIPTASADDALLLQNLDSFMRAEKPFLDPDLKLETLALALNVSERQLSELINRLTGSNYLNFINRHRVEESKNLLRDAREARTSIEVIGLLAGFRSRSTFYESFRRLTGQTPAEYRRAYKS
jgi:AraC-like DNA-binding protein